jgi:hypothetical protein
VSVTLVSPGNVATEIRRVDNHDVFHPEMPDPIPHWLRISADQAARSIVHALIRRRRDCVLTPLAKIAVRAERLAPLVVKKTINLGRIRGRREPRVTPLSGGTAVRTHLC